MRKRLLQSILVIAASIAGFMLQLPLYAQGDFTFQLQEPYYKQVIEGPRMTIAGSFSSGDKNIDVVRADVYVDSDRKHVFGGRFGKLLPAGTFVNSLCDLAAANIAPGEHQVTICLTDASGRVVEQTQTINYQPFKAPTLRSIESISPLVRIIGPKNGDIIEKITEIRVESTDDSPLKLLEVYIDGKTRGVTNSNSYVFSWDPIEEKFVTGKHEISATAWDIFDNKGHSTPVTVYVKNPFMPEGGLNTLIEQPPIMENDTVEGLISVPALTLASNSGFMPFSPLTRSAILPEFTGSSNLVIPDFMRTPAKLYSAPIATLGILSVAPEPTLSMPDSSGNIALAGLIGSDRILGSTQPLAPPAALILPTQEQSGIVLSAPTGTLELPVNAGSGDSAPSLLLSPSLTSSLVTIDMQSPGTIEFPITDITAPAHQTESIRLHNQPVDNNLKVNVSPIKVENKISDGDTPTVSEIAYQSSELPQPVVVALLAPDISTLSAPQTFNLGASDLLSPDNTLLGSTEVRPALVTESTNFTASSLAPAVIEIKSASIPVEGKGTVEEPVLKIALPELSQSMPDALAANFFSNPVDKLPLLLAPVSQNDLSSEGLLSGENPVGVLLISSARSTVLMPNGNSIDLPLPASAPNNSQQTLKSPTVSLPSPKPARSMTDIKSLNANISAADMQVMALLPSKSEAAKAKTAPKQAISSLGKLKDRAPRILLNGTEMKMKPVPFTTEKGYVVVPLRALAEAKGGVMVWNPKTQEVRTWLSHDVLTVKIGKKEATINSVTFRMPVAAAIRESRTVVPVKFLAKGMNLQVEYDEKNSSVILTSK